MGHVKRIGITWLAVSFFVGVADSRAQQAAEADRGAEQAGDAQVEAQELALQWVKQFGGEYQVDESRNHRPVIVLNLDRTRGIDPLFARDTLPDVDLSQLAAL